MITWAPRARSFVAHAFAIAGLLPCVLQVSSLTFVPPALLMAAMWDLAVASAGPSNGAMLPTPSYAQPIVSVFACSDAAVPPPATATATTETAARATSALPRFLISVLLSVPGFPATMLLSL